MEGTGGDENDGKITVELTEGTRRVTEGNGGERRGTEGT